MSFISYLSDFPRTLKFLLSQSVAIFFFFKKRQTCAFFLSMHGVLKSDYPQISSNWILRACLEVPAGNCLDTLMNSPHSSGPPQERLKQPGSPHI